jgi:adenine-specific DNA-methyltransferase
MMRSYVDTIGDTHRKAYGQFFTIPEVAEFMVQWVLESGGESIYDPAFGLGAFYNALPKEKNIEFIGSELDPCIINYFEEEAGVKATFLSNEDYLLTWDKEHKNIVCNPPYMKFQKFLNRNDVFESFHREIGIHLSGYTNTASAFLLKSLSELGSNGRLAYIMPLEFLNTGYGAHVKEQLLEEGHLHSLISINCEKDVFPDATTSVGIILYDKETRHDTVNFYSLNSIEELQTLSKIAPISKIPTHTLNAKQKWLPYFSSRDFEINIEHAVTLKDYGRFSRGIATGANEFFVLNKSNAQTRGISINTECVPCITKSSEIKSHMFDNSDVDKLLNQNEPVLLFSVDGELSSSAQEYLNYGELEGFNKRYLTKMRTPWYKTEVRQPSPLLLGVFSRGGYKIIYNRSNALNLTCYHGFKPNLFGAKYINQLFLYLASKTGRDIVSLSMRKYGSSLDKFEPNDLNGASVPNSDFLSTMSNDRAQEAINEISITDKIPEWVEDFFMPLKKSLNE